MPTKAPALRRHPVFKASAREIQLVFERMHGATIAIDFLGLEIQVGVDQIVAEDAAAGQELTILVKVFESLTQFGADRRETAL